MQQLVKDDIRNFSLSRIVVASCSPTLHEATFRRACQTAELNPYLFEMANIREHCSWVTEDEQLTNEKAKTLVNAAVRWVYYHQSLDCSTCTLTPKMSMVGSHPYIELMAYSEVVEVSGYVGNFKVKIRKKARYIDMDKRTGYGECCTNCPVSYIPQVKGREKWKQRRLMRL